VIIRGLRGGCGDESQQSSRGEERMFHGI
jgi:hypothetical protein